MASSKNLIRAAATVSANLAASTTQDNSPKVLSPVDRLKELEKNHGFFQLFPFTNLDNLYKARNINPYLPNLLTLGGITAPFLFPMTAVRNWQAKKQNPQTVTTTGMQFFTKGLRPTTFHTTFRYIARFGAFPQLNKITYQNLSELNKTLGLEFSDDKIKLIAKTGVLTVADTLNLFERLLIYTQTSDPTSPKFQEFLSTRNKLLELCKGQSMVTARQVPYYLVMSAVTDLLSENNVSSTVSPLIAASFGVATHTALTPLSLLQNYLQQAPTKNGEVQPAKNLTEAIMKLAALVAKNGAKELFRGWEARFGISALNSLVTAMILTVMNNSERYNQIKQYIAATEVTKTPPSRTSTAAQISEEGADIGDFAELITNALLRENPSKDLKITPSQNTGEKDPKSLFAILADFIGGSQTKSTESTVANKPIDTAKEPRSTINNSSLGQPDHIPVLGL